MTELTAQTHPGDMKAQSQSFRYRMIHSAAWDAGNRSMRKASRKHWNEDDYEACVNEFQRLAPEQYTTEVHGDT